MAFCVASLCAQGPQFPDFHFETLTMEDGLNFRDVVAIEQDEDGMMWFGTTQGLIRYDGYQFKLYSSEKNNPLYIPEEAIGGAGIISTGDHQLWFLGHSRLFLLNTATDEVQTFGRDHGINGDVGVILLDDDNKLWIVTDDFYSNPGSAQQGQQFLLRQVTTNSFAIVHSVPRLQSGITAITKSPDGTICWSTLSRGQLFFSREGRLVQTIRPDSSIVLGEKIYAGRSHFTSDGDMFFITGQNEVQKYIPDEGRFETIYQSEEHIYAAREDYKGNLWFGSSRSIYVMTPEGEFHDLSAAIRKRLAFGETHQFFLDQQNLFWIATDFGLLKVKSEDQLFDQFLSGEGNTLGSPMRGFAEAEDGSIVVMNEYERQLYKVLPNDEVIPLYLTCDTEQANTSVLNAARFFRTDRSRRFAYTANKHLVQIDLLNNSCEVDTSINPYPDVHNLNPIEILSDGRLVAGHTLASLQVYDPETGMAEMLLARDEAIPAIENVRFILEGKQPDIIWVGTHENGVFKLEIGGGIVDHLSVSSNPGLTKNAILVIHEDVDTSLWIGTFGGGINHFQPSNRQIQYYNVDDGLSDNNVVGILPQSDSILWISTYDGLSRFNKGTRSFKNFYIEDGLTHNEFNYASYYKDSKGRFYFGGMNGFIRFKPDSYMPDENVYPAPQFTSLTRYDRRANETYVTDLIQNPLDEITLSPYDAYFQVHWTITSYFNNSENRYYIKMEGLDDDWVFVENQPFIRFNRLDPGTYVLRVKATDFRGNEAAAELTLPIHVRRIFYKTWWFIGLCLLALSGLFYAFFQYRLGRLLEIEKFNKVSNRFVPAEFIRALGKDTLTEISLGDQVQRLVTVLFTDIRDYTSLAEHMSPEENFRFVNAYSRRMGPIIKAHEGFVHQYLGDGIMAIFQRSPDDALQAAITMQRDIRKNNVIRKQQSRQPIRVGMGMHTGPLIMGIIGDEQRTEVATIADTVNIAARMESLTKQIGANILLTDECLQKLADPKQYQLRYLGKAKIKGRQASVGVYECFDSDPEEVQVAKNACMEIFDEAIAFYEEQAFSKALLCFEEINAINPADQVVVNLLNESKRYLVEGVPKGWSG